MNRALQDDLWVDFPDFVIPAKAGIQGAKPLMVRLDPGLRRDDGVFLLNLVPFIHGSRQVARHSGACRIPGVPHDNRAFVLRKWRFLLDQVTI